MSGFIARDEPVLIWTGRAMIDGRATIPQQASGLVLIAGLGGTFHHQRIRSLAAHLNGRGFATLITDLLTPDEQQFDARTGHYRVDLRFISERIHDVTRWLMRDELTRDLPIGIFAMGETAAGCLFDVSSIGPFALVLVNPRVGHLREKLGRVDTPALLLVDDSQTWARLALSETSPSIQVEPVPGIAGLLDDDRAARVAGEQAAAWFAQHVPELVPA